MAFLQSRFIIKWPSYIQRTMSVFSTNVILSYMSHTYVKINSQKSLSHSDVFSDPNRISTKTIDGRWKGENRSGIKWWTRRRMLSERTCGPHIFSLKLWTPAMHNTYKTHSHTHTQLHDFILSHIFIIHPLKVLFNIFFYFS